MSISESILGPIVEAIFGYVLEQSGLAERLHERLKGDPIRRAFERALRRAFDEFEAQHPAWVAANFDASFFAHEGAEPLAQFLRRDGQPDPSDLAARWADSLHMRNPELRNKTTRELEPVAADLLDKLNHALKAEPELSTLYDSRTFEEINTAIQAIRKQLGANQATPDTRRDYLHWLIERNTYLDARGTLQTQRQVQVRLDEVYVALRARHETTPGHVDRRLAAELQALEAQTGLSAEDRHEALLARHAHTEPAARHTESVLELAEAVTRHHHLVILGDPGSGKTTLLSYLALKHATALRDGHSEAGADLGAPRFPIFLRIAEYAESGAWRTQSLSDTLASHYSRLECPVTGLADLIERELKQGNCLVLLDGLDEVVSADERRAVVKRIEDFIRRYDDQGNRFVITSRVAGYRSAPLASDFAHYTAQEMDDAQIRRFLECWCPAVEAAQTPDLSVTLRQEKAQREIDGILRAITTTPGVRRLAANPLLLHILALIHHTGAKLPQKRIELYKLAADTLARTWRIAQGIHESALIKDEYLTRLLGKLAYWMHCNKPSGIATEQEVYAVLGEEWARIKGLLWDAAEPHPDIKIEVKRFLLAVREHTGLFVERAPRRYGFMHLTFEEYYAARHLVANASKRVKLIRHHLHDPRWDEPILLALGFVGLDYSEDAAELFAAAILAEGELAEDLGLSPGRHEKILGRDFLFALHCLADQIPAELQLHKRLVSRLCSELLQQYSGRSYERYQRVLNERVRLLPGSPTFCLLLEQLGRTLDDSNNVEVRRAAISILTQMEAIAAEIVPTLVAMLGDKAMAATAARALQKASEAHPAVILAAMRDALQASNPTVRRAAAQVLGAPHWNDPSVCQALLAMLPDPDLAVRSSVIWSLVRIGKNNPQVAIALLPYLHDSDAQIREQTIRALEQLGQSPPEVIAALIAVLNDRNDEQRYRTVWTLARLGKGNPLVRDALIAALADSSSAAYDQIVSALAALGFSDPTVSAALVPLLQHQAPDIRTATAYALAAIQEQSRHRFPSDTQLAEDLLAQYPEIISILTDALEQRDLQTREEIAWTLAELGIPHHLVIEEMLDTLRNSGPDTASSAAEMLGKLGVGSSAVATALIAALEEHDNEDPDDEMLIGEAAAALETLAVQHAEVLAALIAALDHHIDSVCENVAWVLGKLAERHPPALADLLATLRSGTLWQRQYAALACSYIDEPSVEVLDALCELLADSHPDLRIAAAWALADLKQPSAAVLAALRTTLNDRDTLVQQQAAGALAMLGQHDAPILALLPSALNTVNGEMLRQAIATIIGQYGAADAPSINALVQGLLDRAHQVRAACTTALVQLKQRYPDRSAAIEQPLIQALHDPRFIEIKPRQYHSHGNDAFEALWLLAEVRS